MITVLTVVSTLGRGGTQRCAQNYAISYRECGMQSLVGTLRGGGVRHRVLTDAGVLVVATETESLLAAIERIRPDVIHLHRSDSLDQDAIKVLQLAERLGIRRIQTNVFSRPDMQSFAHLVELDLQLSTWCMLKWKHRAAGLSGRGLGAVLPYFVDETVFIRPSVESITATRLEFGVTRGEVVFGRVGQPIDSKWSVEMITLIESTFKLADPVIFVFVGAPKTIISRVHSSPLTKKFVLLPPIDGDERLSSLYASFDYFLHMAELGESFGMVLLESVLCGTPVITWARPGRDNTQAELMHITNGGWCGWSQSQMRRLLVNAANRELYTNMERARTRVVELFGRSTCRHCLGRLVAIVCGLPRERWESALVDSGFVVEGQVANLESVARAFGGMVSARDRVSFRLTHAGRLYRLCKGLLAKTR